MAVVRRAPRYPASWDARVAGLARFVESNRGLTFAHPVHVDFLDDAAFGAEVAVAGGEPTPTDRAAMQAEAARLRAFGLLDGELDLIAAGGTLAGETTLAFYRFEDERIIVRGTAIDTSLEVTLVHELTHALQDQHYQLGKRTEERESNSAFGALVEGDAEYVANLYLESLPPTEQEAYYEEQQRIAEDIDLGDIPEVLLAMQSTPYELGPGLGGARRAAGGPPRLAAGGLWGPPPPPPGGGPGVGGARRADGGTRRLDDAFMWPPTTDEQLLSPSAYLAQEDALSVGTPAVFEGEQRVPGTEPDTFGALSWYVVLTERIDPHDALAAVDGWGGDIQVNLERDGKQCARLLFRGDHTTDADEMASALREWADRMPDGMTDLRTADDSLTFTACDPGKSAHLATGRAADAMVLPVARSQVFAMLLADGEEVDASWCFADAIVAGSSVKELLDTEGGFFATPEGQDRIANASAECSLGGA